MDGNQRSETTTDGEPASAERGERRGDDILIEKPDGSGDPAARTDQARQLDERRDEAIEDWHQDHPFPPAEPT